MVIQHSSDLDSTNLESLLPQVVSIAIAAGSEILDIYAGEDLGTTYKADDSPLTCADMAAHHLILMRLQDLDPVIPVLSEESKEITYAQRQHWQQFWLVDPLDGTKEFIKRNGQFTVNIALITQGRPVLGVIYAPVLHLAYWAAQGLGAFKQDSSVSVIPIHTRAYPESVLKVVSSGSHAGSETEMFLDKLKAECGSIEVLSMGSSLKSCLVADGSAHLYPRLGPTMEWDTGAAQCIVEQAGGQMTDLQGNPLHYNKPNLLNPHFMVCTKDLAGIWPKLLVEN